MVRTPSKSAASLGLLLLLSAVAWSAASDAKRPATRPADQPVKDVEGRLCHPLSTGGAKAAVVFFLSHDCPISNGYSPEINRICKEFGGDGKVVFHIVHPYEKLSADEARKHAKEFAYTVPVIVDADKQLTRSLRATTTPQVFVLTPDGEVAYSGRIDNLWSGFGKRRTEPTVRDLRDSLSAILAGKPVPNRSTDSIGCPIEP
ncbi:redoxin domain-containing protein [Humisphaera borealis]|uniref:Redoxin domain-containing protein n=1 Tax=Humisphaera borealis TaxID=2807512 RepID=A0A7M2X0K5_9BACT|nr:redoxin domain-containing protein [Humisphaera borealis]QOV91288.1 redoxin domain-containing protein [Humisphaera borealis]